MPIIYLTDGSSTKVDQEDYLFLLSFNWYPSSAGYVVSCIYINKKKIDLLMHVMILKRMGFSNFEMGDHRDRNKRNNHRYNLRPSNRFTNQQNAVKTSRKTTSRFKGVHYRKERMKWEATIYVFGERMRLGLYPTEIQAAYAYNRAAIRYFGEFARLNDLSGY